MRGVTSVGWFVLMLCGCSDDGSNSPGAGGAGAAGGVSGGTGAAGGSGGASAGGTPASAGSMAVSGAPGLSGSGGVAAGAGNGGQGGSTSGGGASAGASGKGGAGPTGGANPGGGPLPAGKVTACFGDACPLGECDNGRIASDTRCADVYSAPVGEDSMFCKSSASGDYCLTVATSTAVEYWTVVCAAGTATGTDCASGCGIAADHAKCN